MKDSFVFYRSFYEAIKDLPRDIQGEIYTAIMEYGLNGKETENLKPIAKSLFVLIKPLIDKNNQRYENGKKGGRPRKTETEQKPNNNQNKTEQKPNNNPNVDVNDNVNVNEEDNNSVEGEKGFSPQTQKIGNPEFLSDPNSQNQSKSEAHVGETEGGAPEKSPPPKRKSKKPIEERAIDFKMKIWRHVQETEYKTETDELGKFWEYWSEHGSRDRLMRYEKEKSFSIARRLKTWFDNREKFNNNGSKNSRRNSEEDRTQAAIKETYARLAAKSKSYY